MRSWNIRRHFAQLLATAAADPFVSNFWTGSIYKGPAKQICTPGLNCYSCPAAAGACPIGSIQTVAAGNRLGISFYAYGFLIIMGALLGRIVCGFLCPFGFIQDLLHKIPVRKFDPHGRIDALMRYMKYLILISFVILLPLIVRDQFGLSKPFFCKYICPAGTIEAGIPVLLTNGSLRQLAGVLFSWKLLLAILLIGGAMVIYRPFCKYICPLGAIYSLFNRVSLIQMYVDKGTCTGCGLCERSCLMNVKVTENINSPECIRCGKCKAVCPVQAIKWKNGMVSLENVPAKRTC